MSGTTPTPPTSPSRRRFSDHVRRAAGGPFVDSRIRPFLASAGGKLQEPAELFHRVASFVNWNLYSLDTIFDKESKVLRQRQKGITLPPS